MHRRIRRRHLLAGLLGLAVLAPAQVAGAGTAEPSVPSRIQVPDGHKLYLVAHAEGAQIYACTPTASGQEWRLSGPRADLIGDAGNEIGTHYAGPTWQAKDGSSVKGVRVDGVNVDPTAVDWLLLSATSPTAGADGDRLAHTPYIQRINTTGGRAPAGGCTPETVGDTAEIPYTADYAFWKSRGA